MTVTDYCGWCGQQVPGDMADHDCLDPDPNLIPFRHTIEIRDLKDLRPVHLDEGEIPYVNPPRQYLRSDHPYPDGHQFRKNPE